MRVPAVFETWPRVLQEIPNTTNGRETKKEEYIRADIRENYRGPPDIDFQWEPF